MNHKAAENLAGSLALLNILYPIAAKSDKGRGDHQAAESFSIALEVIYMLNSGLG